MTKKKFLITPKEYNIALIGLILFGIISLGIVFNFLAVSSNSGKMPVLSNLNYETKKHFTFQDFNEVEHPYLSDIMTYETKNHFFKFSIGDILLTFGALFYLLFAVILTIGHRRWYKLNKKRVKNEKRRKGM